MNHTELLEHQRDLAQAVVDEQVRLYKKNTRQIQADLDEARNGDKTKPVERLQQNLNARTAELDICQKKLREAVKEHKGREAELGKLLKSNKQLQSNIEQWQAQLNEHFAGPEIKNANDVIAQHRDLKAQLATTKAAVQNLKEKQQTTQEQLDRVEKGRQETKSKARAQFKKNKKTIQARVKKFHDRAAEIKTGFQEKLNAKQESADQLKKQLAEAVAKHETAFSRASTELKQLRGDNAGLLATQSTQAKKNALQITELEQQLAKAVDEHNGKLEQLRENNVGLATTNKTQAEEHDLQITELKQRLAEAVDTHNSEVRLYDATLKQLRENNVGLATTNKTQAKAIANLKHAKFNDQAANSPTQKTKDAIAKVKEYNAEQEQKAKQHYEENVRLKEQLKEFSDTSRRNAELSAKNVELQEDLRGLDAEFLKSLSTMRAELERAKQEFSDREFSGLPGVKIV